MLTLKEYRILATTILKKVTNKNRALYNFIKGNEDRFSEIITAVATADWKHRPEISALDTYRINWVKWTIGIICRRKERHLGIDKDLLDDIISFGLHVEDEETFAKNLKKHNQLAEKQEINTTSEELDSLILSVPLTERESAVVNMTRDGYTNKEIWTKLGISKQRVQQLFSSAINKIRENNGIIIR